MPLNCTNVATTATSISGRDILLALPSESIVCFQGSYYVWFRLDFPVGADQMDTAYNGCPLWAIQAPGPVPNVYVQFGWLIQENGGKQSYFTDAAKLSATQVGEVTCPLPVVGPGDETPGEPAPLPEAPAGMPESCCDKLAEILQTIGEVLGELVEKTTKPITEACTLTDACLNEIVGRVLSEIEKPIKTCDSCCADLAAGISMSAADAAICADCACEAAGRECSVNDLQPGERCPKCDKEPCCCTKDYTCEPCEPEEKKKRFVGWCNSLTGATIVLDEGKPPPAPVEAWQRASLSESESAALQQAIAYCQRKPTEPERTPFPSIHPGGIGSRCAIETFASPGLTASLLQGTAATLNAATAEEIMRAGIDTVVGLIPGEGIIQQLISPLKSLAYGPIITAARLAESFGQAIGCKDNGFDSGFVALAMLSVIGKYTGVNVEEFATPILYSLNSVCRRKHLSPGDAMSAWLSGSVSEQELDTLWGMAGFCSDALNRAKVGSQSKPIPSQLAVLRRRDLMSVSEYHAGMRKLGYINGDSDDRLFKLSEEIPGPSELVWMMKRDVADEELVTRFGMDTDFDKKYVGDVERWSRWRGQTPEIFKAHWRAHWSIPAPTQLYEMFHRLRRDPQYGGEEKFRQDVKQSLQQQDIMPFWIDKLLAISFRPLSRVDTRRAFNMGALGDDDVARAYQNLGYDDDNVDRLVKFAKRLRADAASGHRAIKLWVKFAINGAECERRMLDGGLPPDVVSQAMRDSEPNFATSFAAKAFTNGELGKTDFTILLTNHGVSVDGTDRLISKLGWTVKKHWSIDQYKAGLLARSATESLLSTYGVATGRASEWIDSVDLALDAAGSVACQNNVKHRYLHGEIDATQVANILAGSDITAERVQKLLRWWNCELSTQGKAVPAATLCTWVERGAIGPAEFVDRLVRIGYKRDDAINLLVDCTSKIGARRAAEAKKQAEQNAAALQKAEQAAKKASAEVERNRAKMERMRNQAKATKERREKQVLSASVKLGKRCNCEWYDALQAVRATVDRLQDRFGLSLDESIIAALQASESTAVASLQDYADVADSFAEAAVAVPTETSEFSPNGQASSSG